MMHVGACGLGWESSVALTRASLMTVKADVASSTQTRSCLPFAVGESMELRGSSIAAQWGMKRW